MPSSKKSQRKNKIIVIVGPTASGKSEAAVRLAKKIGGPDGSCGGAEIISADSRQVYKNLNVGSGKITKKEMGGIPHHCLDIARPSKIFTAADYTKCARKAIKKIFKKNKIPIIVGGTGFYIDAALGRVALAQVPPNFQLRKKLANYSTNQLFRILKKLNPARAKKIDKYNKVRIVRAIEIIGSEKTSAVSSFILGRPATASEVLHLFASPSARTMPKRAKNPFRDPLVPSSQIFWIGIKPQPEILKKNIHNRLLKRMPAIIREIKKLRNPSTGGGISWKRLYDLGLEYRYVSLYVLKKNSKSEMIEKLEREINKYAKRQMTYFKRNKNIRWVLTPKATFLKLF